MSGRCKLLAALACVFTLNITAFQRSYWSPRQRVPVEARAYSSQISTLSTDGPFAYTFREGDATSLLSSLVVGKPPTPLLPKEGDGYYRPTPPDVPHFYANNLLQSPCTNWKRETSVMFDAEFGMELIVALPYLYSRHLQCFKTSVISLPGTRSLYFFVQSHAGTRTHRIAQNRFVCCSLSQIHVPILPKHNYAPPPLKQHYQNNHFIFAKPLLVITNKYQTEWGSDPMNFIPVETLGSLVDMLSPYYTIVYNRPTDAIAGDNSELLVFGDIEMLRKKNTTILLADLWQSTREKWGKAMGEELTFNLFQLWLYANADKYISVQGGNSVLTSYMAGKNGTVIVYSRAGNELHHNSIGTWYTEFSNATVVDVHDTVSLVREVASRYIPDAAVATRITRALPPPPKLFLRQPWGKMVPRYTETPQESG
eukprot:gene16265-24926_t